MYRDHMKMERDKNPLIPIEDDNKLLKTEILFEKAQLQCCERLS